MTTEQGRGKGIVWVLVSPEDVRIWSSDDGLAVVYCGVSGDTHLVSALAGEILRLLQTASRTPEMLYGQLADAFRGHDTDAALDIIRMTLSQLQDIHLVSSNQN